MSARFEGKVALVTGAGSGVARGIVFLASEEARSSTGVVLPIDGGSTA
jgi:NAD(P)-dependent dehydrogenase (short-subunit alcohol dehydrogenase family)